MPPSDAFNTTLNVTAWLRVDGLGDAVSVATTAVRARAVSAAVSLAKLVSPPPETVNVLTTIARETGGNVERHDEVWEVRASGGRIATGAGHRGDRARPSRAGEAGGGDARRQDDQQTNGSGGGDVAGIAHGDGVGGALLALCEASAVRGGKSQIGNSASGKNCEAGAAGDGVVYCDIDSSVAIEIAKSGSRDVGFQGGAYRLAESKVAGAGVQIRRVIAGAIAAQQDIGDIVTIEIGHDGQVAADR